MWLILIFVFHFKVILSASVAFNGNNNVTLQLHEEFVPALTLDFNLCKVFQPMPKSSDRFWIGHRALKSTSKRARFMVVYQCQKTSVESIYNGFLQRAFECEDTRFTQVSDWNLYCRCC